LANEAAGQVRKATYLGSHVEYEVAIEGVADEVLVVMRDVARPLSAGDAVGVAILPGAIHAPADDRLFSAMRGGGAFLNGRFIGVSRLAHGSVPVIEVGWSDRRPIAEYGAVLQRLSAQGFEFRRHGSGALALAKVTAGLNDGYIELHINAWDALAGILLVQEAGSRCNDFLADGGLTGGNPLVAGTPEVWDRIMQAALPG